jgi:hypothetical protein
VVLHPYITVSDGILFELRRRKKCGLRYVVSLCDWRTITVNRCAMIDMAGYDRLT